MILFVTVFSAQSLFACFAVVVGKNASTDGSVLVGHDEQNSGNLFINFRKIPRMHYKKGAVVDLKNGGKIPQVSETNAYLWSEIPGATSSDNYINEYGVVIVSDYCADKINSDTKTLEKEGQIVDGGLSYMLRKIVMERAKTARQGVEIAGKLIDKYGYTSNRSFVIADPNEAWIMSVTDGKQWVAARVPDNEVVLLPNVYVIKDVNPNDPKNFILSKNLISFAEKKGWYNPKKDKTFDFAKAYSLSRKQLIDPRQWFAQQVITGEKINIKPDRQLPFSVKPDHKVSLKEVMAILRYTNTDNYFSEYYKTMVENGKKFTPPEGWNYRNMCLRRTQEGAVFQLNSKYPPAIGCIDWRASAAPNTSVFLPWYVGITSTPKSYYYPGDLYKIVTAKYHFDTKSYNYKPNYKKAWWVFRKLQGQVNLDSMVRTAEVRKVWDTYESNLIKEQAKVQADTMKLYKQNKKAAYKYLTKYCSSVSTKAIKEARKLSKQYPKLKCNPNNILDPGAKKVKKISTETCPFIPGKKK
ncbi:MAG TPA: C69 family dipeptidase [Victivallales bacterium]|nr:C69 family dipeptidase [Victivallales bacterium]